MDVEFTEVKFTEETAKQLAELKTGEFVGGYVAWVKNKILTVSICPENTKHFVHFQTLTVPDTCPVYGGYFVFREWIYTLGGESKDLGDELPQRFRRQFNDEELRLVRAAITRILNPR